MFDDVSTLLPGLREARWRGIRFYIPDTSIEAGRRVQKHYFPGRDATHFDDMGKHAQVITITGLIVGDDYVTRAEAMIAAMEKPGPGTLSHPWLGAIRVLLIEPGAVYFSAQTLRLATVSATFARMRAGAAAAAIDTAAAVTVAAGAVRTASGALSDAVLLPSPATVAVARAAAAQASSIAGHWRASIDTHAPALNEEIGVGLARMDAVAAGDAAKSESAVAAAYCEGMKKLSADFAEAGKLAVSPAIGAAA